MRNEELLEERITVNEKGDGNFQIAKNVIKETTSRLNLSIRDKNLLTEIYYGYMVPVQVIKELFYAGHESYRKKRMSIIKQNGLISLNSYCKSSADSKTRTIGQLYRLTELGIYVVEKILNKGERQGKIKIMPPRKDKIEQYWYIGRYRVIAHELGIQWQYGRQIREQIYINHNIYISAVAGNICIYTVGKKPNKHEVKHLRSSIKHLTESGYQTHIIICPSSAVRKQVIFGLLELEYDEKQKEFLYEKGISVFIQTVEEAQVCLMRLLQDASPHDMLIQSLRQGTEIEIIEIDHPNSVTPFMGKKDDDLYFLSSYSDYNIIEFIKVCKYNSKLFQKGGWPGKILMHINDVSQLNEIAEIYVNTTEPKSEVTYLLQEPHNGTEAYLIENGTLIPKR